MSQTHHSNLSIGRSQAGSATARSLREQRKEALTVDMYISSEQQQQPPYKEQADERRHIRHSRSFSNMEYTPQKARLDGYAINSVNTPETQRQMVAPHSDSKYASNTVSYRASERQQRAQRRKTDGSDEIREFNRRPSTSHGSDTQRKATYSQYPDFETIKDPFAKRDKIPRKHREPLHLDKKKEEEKEEDNGAEALEEGHARKDSQEGVPTPLKKRDKIPRHAVRQAPPPPPPLPVPQANEVRPIESLQMEPMDAVFPESPVTPVAQMRVPVAKQGTDRSARLESLISPVSLASPGAEVRPLQPAHLPAPVRTVSMRPVDTRGAAVMSPLSPLSGHTNSPRMDIDMDKVETLYARQSIIFERTKQSQQGQQGQQNMRDSKMFSSSSASVDKSAQADGPREVSANGAGGADNEDDDGDDDDQHIPFDQVLIPTAFKRLRQALDDPNFEIDEETYRRFKLSERWYVREERMQMELAFNMGTFGESRKRTRVVQKRASQDSSETPYAEEVPAAKINSNVLSTLAEHDDGEADGRLERDGRARHDVYYDADHPPASPTDRTVRVPEAVNAATAAAAYRPSLIAAAASVSALSTSQYYPSYEAEQRGYVPPRQPEHVALEPMHVQDAAPQRSSHSRKHRHAERRPPPEKKGLCGMCVVM